MILAANYSLTLPKMEVVLTSSLKEMAASKLGVDSAR